jgi:hypothetical protein
MTTDDNFRSAIAHDEWLRNLTPQQWAERDAAAPPGSLDQLGAAGAEAVAIAEAILGNRAESIATCDVSDWLRLGLLDAFTTWAAGKGKTCLHASHYSRPEPVWSAAWKPGLVICGLCTHLFRMTEQADYTCD